MRILITGASGFIGRAVCRELSGGGFEIFAVGGVKGKREFSAAGRSGGDFRADVTNEEDVRGLESIGAVDALVHGAGLAHQFGDVRREDFQRINVEGTKNVLRLAERLNARHFVLLGSVAVYGGAEKKEKPGAPEIDETNECEPEGFYAESKYESEKAAIEFCAAKAIDLTVLRLATVIGEEDAGNFLRLVRAIDRRRFVWIGSGENRKSFVYRGDVARCCRTILEKKKPGAEIFNVSAEPIRVSEAVETIAETLSRSVPKFSIPPAVLGFFFNLNAKTFRFGKVRKISRLIEKWLSEDVYSARKIKERYDFQTSVAAREAVRREAQWYRRRK